MAHRVVEIEFRPTSKQQWDIHGSVRREAARLWVRLTKLHAFVRRRRWKWPSKSQLERWAKGKFAGLHSQSVQQTVAEFFEAVDSTRQRRLKGATKTEACYPWKTRQRYRSVTFTNQAPRFKSRKVLLPCGVENGKRRYLSVPLPAGFQLPGKLCEVRLEFARLAFVVKLAEPATAAGADNQAPPTIGGDLGVNSLIAATDGDRAMVVSGREAKAIVQYRNKQLAEISALQSQRTKGSQRWRRLQKRKRQMLARTRRKMRDMAHKASRAVARAFPGARIILGLPFNDAARKMGRRQAQTVSQAINGLLTRYLGYKLGAVEQIGEHWTSQTCPVCGARHKCGRIYRCKDCGFSAPRDVVGCINIRGKGL